VRPDAGGPNGFSAVASDGRLSKTIERVDLNSRLVRGDLAEEIGRLKEQPGERTDIGGPTLAG
jgi:hypothetical protein